MKFSEGGLFVNHRHTPCSCGAQEQGTTQNLGKGPCASAATLKSGSRAVSLEGNWVVLVLLRLHRLEARQDAACLSGDKTPHGEPHKKRDAVLGWPGGWGIEREGRVEGHGCTCVTPGPQRSLGDARGVVGESMHEGTRRFGLLLSCELTGTHGLM